MLPPRRVEYLDKLMYETLNIMSIVQTSMS